MEAKLNTQQRVRLINQVLAHALEGVAEQGMYAFQDDVMGFEGWEETEEWKQTDRILESELRQRVSRMVDELISE